MNYEDMTREDLIYTMQFKDIQIKKLQDRKHYLEKRVNDLTKTNLLYKNTIDRMNGVKL